MRFEEFKFEDLPNIMAENNRLLSEVKVLLSAATIPQTIPSDLLSIQQASELLNLVFQQFIAKLVGETCLFANKEKNFISLGKN